MVHNSQVLTLSPAQLLTGQRLKTKPPTSAELLMPQLDDDVDHSIREAAKIKAALSPSSKAVTTLMEGEKVIVRLKENWQSAVIVRRHENPRLVIIQTAETPTGGISNTC